MLKPCVENILQFSGWFGKNLLASEVGTMTKRGPVCAMKSAPRLVFSGVRKPFTRLLKYQTKLGSVKLTAPNSMVGRRSSCDSRKSSYAGNNRATSGGTTRALAK